MNNEEQKRIAEEWVRDGKPEDTLKPFDRVLVRDEDDEKWKADIYSHYDNRDNILYPHITAGSVWMQCIPYEGNEHLLGTKDKPTAQKA